MISVQLVRERVPPRLSLNPAFSVRMQSREATVRPTPGDAQKTLIEAGWTYVRHALVSRKNSALPHTPTFRNDQNIEARIDTN